MKNNTYGEGEILGIMRENKTNGENRNAAECDGN